MKKAVKLLAVILILLAVSWLILMNMPQAQTMNKSASVSVDAKTLFVEYSESESAAGEKYNGMIVQVEGRVLDISKDKQGAAVILLDAQNEFAGILCTLQDINATLPKIGDNIVIKGQCNGLLTDVVLNKCVIEKII